MLLLLREERTDSVFLQFHVVTIESYYWVLDVVKFISYKDLSPRNHKLPHFQLSGFTKPFSPQMTNFENIFIFCPKVHCISILSICSYSLKLDVNSCAPFNHRLLNRL